MDVLDEAKEIMKKAGCDRAFAFYKLELYDIAEVKNCSKNEEIIEMEKEISKLVPSMKKEIVLERDEPIECPLDASLSKYLEFSLKDKIITPYNLSSEECERIKQAIKPLLEKYHWSIKKR